MTTTEETWTEALTSILDELEKSQYRKLLEYLVKIPQSEKTGRFRETMPRKIIQYYGLPESIDAIDDIMRKIPRNDPKIQNLLLPFVDKLRKEQEKENQGTKRKREEDEGLADEAPQKKPVLGQQKSRHQELDGSQDTTTPWKISIRDLKSNGILEKQCIVGTVVQKSGLRPYRTKDQVQKFLFYVAVADETSSVKLTVYGKDRYKDMEEESSYLFRNLTVESDDFKVTTFSKVSQTKPPDVPEELKLEARRLIYPESPLYSVEQVKSSADKTEVSVEGTVEEIEPVGKTKVKYKRQKEKRQYFTLKDDTDSIRVCMWGGATKQCDGLAVGDVIKATNMKTSHYHTTVSLNSTGFTRIHQVQSVGVQNVRIEIIGIRKATRKETHLDAAFGTQVHTLVVASPLLAKAFGFRLEGSVKERLLDRMPLSADVQIRGNNIKKVTAAQKM